MKFLIRCEPPIILSKLKENYGSWSRFTDDEFEELWLSLEKMQGNFCAYCENNLVGRDKHIEHFVPRSRNSRLTFEWENLFGSCNSSNNCGRYKDVKVTDYDINNILKPDIDDASEYFTFSSTGGINIKKNLSDTSFFKAEETIRVLNLDSTELNSIRRTLLGGYIQVAKEKLDLMEICDNEEDIDLILREYMQIIKDMPFYSALFQLIFN
ncbi:TIGR02646 family protein [Acinetobacter baumannii]|uniref:retron Ec78 anti-phage system effector HNH endonuclease PtuB n=1 Tax=Acinetobacter baumannii TaxID=470 RepID=UPI0029299B0E|nr:TIGR02646 family protein [Acinetobacter baumannii]ELT0788290.1 TIGR02646 family protein [Acinetobacter baumannii]